MRLHYLALLPMLLVPAGVPDAAPDTPLPSGSVTGTIKAIRNGTAASTDGTWVYLLHRDKLKSLPFKPRTDFVITQKGDQFSPRSLTVPRHSTVAFPNRDAKDHNVFSPSLFDLSRYGGGTTRSQKFELVKEYDIFCDIHRNMEASINVVETDLIAPVVNGSFTIKGVPPGTYKVWAWGPHSKPVSDDPITVVNTEVKLPYEIKLQLGPATKPHSRKNGEPYCLAYKCPGQ